MGPIGGGYLCSILGFEWAAAVLSFTGLFVVSVYFVHIQTIFKTHIHMFWTMARTHRRSGYLDQTRSCGREIISLGLHCDPARSGAVWSGLPWSLAVGASTRSF